VLWFVQPSLSVNRVSAATPAESHGFHPAEGALAHQRVPGHDEVLDRHAQIGEGLSSQRIQRRAHFSSAPAYVRYRDFYTDGPVTDTGMMEHAESPVRVGGQALPDGVLMRTSRAWAIARADGSVMSGALPTARFENVPVVRVLTGLGPALALGLAGGGRNDAGGRRQPRKPPWAMISGIVLAEGAALAVSRVAGAARLSGHLTPLVSLGLLAVALTVFRAATPPRQWRYHGAEHKAVTAHERGIILTDLDRVLACPRVHPRCGTNLIVWMAVAALWLGRLPLLIQLPAVVLTLACVAEIVTAAGQHKTTMLAKFVLTPGEVLQRFLTTSEPSPDEQSVACRAISACLELHGHLAETALP
jgi:hypothetical protein